MFFFFKQKTAYELRISDWSSDVCSSDLSFPIRLRRPPAPCIEAGDRADREQGTQAARWRLRAPDQPSHGFGRHRERTSSVTPHARESPLRSEERRVGKEGVSTCRARGSPDHLNKQQYTYDTTHKY